MRMRSVVVFIISDSLDVNTGHAGAPRAARRSTLWMAATTKRPFYSGLTSCSEIAFATDSENSSALSSSTTSLAGALRRMLTAFS